MNLTNYTPSVNIIRDQNKNLNYMPTANSKRIYNQLVSDYSTGFSSFSLIGPYGTGKSAFMWAFEQQLKYGEKYFVNIKGEFKGVKEFDIANFVGDYSSFMSRFAEKFKIKKYMSPDDVVKGFDDYYKKSITNDKLLVIVVDEFGKHLEYSAANEPEKEMYFIQLLTEYINDRENNIIFISILHQNFDSYGESLNFHQKQEWNKVRGRIKELSFNEPVEQLLSLAAQYLTNSKKKYSKREFINFDGVYHLINKSKLLPIKSEISKEQAMNLFPFDLLGASILTISLQKYGQNERSLFSFLNSKDYLGINDYDFETNLYYNVSAVYDYLLNNYYSFIFTKYNPHFTQWLAIRTAVERVEGLFDKEITDAAKIIKTIGLLNIFSPESAALDLGFLFSYSAQVLCIPNSEIIIEKLRSSKVIRYAEYKKKFILFEGTDIDIDHVLHEASGKVDKNINLTNELNKYFDFPYEMAKRVSLEKGTPRFFQYIISDEPIQGSGKLKVDGVINLLLSSDNKIDTIIELSKHDNPILYGFYKNTNEVIDLIWEINKIKYVIENDTHDDFIAKRELNKFLSYQIDLLNSAVLGSFYNDDKIVWIFNGELKSLMNYRAFNDQLSVIIETVFPFTPRFKNELINRDRLPGAITVARKSFFNALINSWEKPAIGLPDDKFPPEKMIYYTLLYNTQVHKKDGEEFVFDKPSKKSTFTELWNASEKFITEAKTRKKSISELYEILSNKPYGLKHGFLEFWLPTFLFIKRNDFALFIEDRYQPFMNEDIFEMFIKIPKKIQIKTFNVEGVKLDLFNKYRKFIKASESKLSNESFIDTIKPFLIFYKKLPEYTKKTKSLSLHSIKLRDAIANSKDPETTFFDDFPKALGYHDIHNNHNEDFIKGYVEKLQDSINEIKVCYDELLADLESKIIEFFGEEKNDLKLLIEKTRVKYSLLLEFKLSAKQKAFISRITNDLNDREKWLSSIVQILINKSLDNITDQEYPIIIDRLKSAFTELDDLYDITKTSDLPELDNISKITISSFGKDTLSQVVSIPNNKSKSVKKLQEDLSKELSNDRESNIAALLNLLKRELGE